ncbi:uncharacterized protein BX664DRAFT_346929 [Halteromyces radiatus]|uniref:uncharacterized protein n=1 Tax=Halteromyces radiatus TaxID=101107 RepID=UPI00221E6697|nr:uncharacterized protein BX664DRAFT_346929 [Halteromyces radiatus]KAI8096905.1 hypothetical protein BX664DRAFT_346929 [Halteromyces radiatus]
MPTQTSPSIQSASIQPVQPTQPPSHSQYLVKRDDDNIQATLSLYQNWASVCNNDNNNQVAVAISIDPKMQQLWQTVTQTVNCGHGTVKTVTRTITATATATTSGTNPTNTPTCDQQCWSDYLWHTYGYGISVAQALTGIVCMMIGIYFMVFGFRFFRPTLGFTGFVFFAVMTWIGLTNNEPASGYPNTDLLYVCVSAGMGLVGAGLGVFFFVISIYMVGGLGGFYFAVWILSWKASLIITVKVAQICFIIGVGLVTAILLYLLETYILIMSTAFIGAYLVLFGLDFFAHTGMLNAWLLIFDANPNHFNSYMIQRPVLVMLSFVAVLFLMSVGWQYYWNVMRHKRSFGVPKKAKVVENE